MIHTGPVWKSAVVAALGWVPAATVLVHRVVGWGNLPESLPTHWPLLGEADGFSPRDSVWWVTLGVCVGAAAAATVAAALERRSDRWTRAGCVLGLGVAGASAGAWWAAVGTTMVTTTDPLGLWSYLALAGFLWAAPCYWLLSRLSPKLLSETAVPRLNLEPNERAVWSQVVGAPWLTFVTVGATAVAMGVAVVNPELWSTAAVFAAITLLLARIEVTVDRRGLRVVAGLLRVPIKRVPLEKVVQATAESIRPLEWGGWDYRITPGRSAVVLRSGPAVVLRLTNGRSFAATVDDPETAAALLNGLRVPS